MPYLGSAPRTTNAANLIDHKEYLGANADTATNSGYYTFVASYTPNHVSVIVRGINLATCLLYTSPSPRDRTRSRMPSSA